MGRITKGRIRPHQWKSGSDPLAHTQYYVWLQQKNQAQWREEGWDLSFDTWREMWSELWHLRGRSKGTYCMSRKDWSLPWNKSNVCIIPREEHAIMQGKARTSGWHSIAYKRRLSKGQ